MRCSKPCGRALTGAPYATSPRPRERYRREDLTQKEHLHRSPRECGGAPPLWSTEVHPTMAAVRGPHPGGRRSSPAAFRKSCPRRLQRGHPRPHHLARDDGSSHDQKPVGPVVGTEMTASSVAAVDYRRSNGCRARWGDVHPPAFHIHHRGCNRRRPDPGVVGAQPRTHVWCGGDRHASGRIVTSRQHVDTNLVMVEEYTGEVGRCAARAAELAEPHSGGASNAIFSFCANGINRQRPDHRRGDPLPGRSQIDPDVQGSLRRDAFRFRHPPIPHSAKGSATGH